MVDWIDREKDSRQRGFTRPLLQSEHAAVNARHPGCTLEHCGVCGEPTGNAGRGEDSNYCEHCDAGPFCWECWEGHACLC